MATASAGGGLAGSADCPWTVAVEQGQRINLSLIVLPARTSLTSRRDAFIDMDDDVTNGSVLLPLYFTISRQGDFRSNSGNITLA